MAEQGVRAVPDCVFLARPRDLGCFRRVPARHRNLGTVRASANEPHCDAKTTPNEAVHRSSLVGRTTGDRACSSRKVKAEIRTGVRPVRATSGRIAAEKLF